MSSGESLGRVDAPVHWLAEESLPEITLLDVTCDTTIPATPGTAGSVNSRFKSLHLSQLSSNTNLNTTGQTPCPQKKPLDFLQSNVSSPKAKPSAQNGTKTLSEMSSSDTISDKENHPEVASPEFSKHNETTACTDLSDMMVDPSESMYAPECWLDVRYFPEITLLDVTRDSEPSPGGELSTMDTQGSVVENSSFVVSSEPIGPNTVKIQTSAEDTFDNHPANVTHDISSSSDMSVQCTSSQSSSSDVHSNTITSELHEESVMSSNTVEANSEELLSSHDAKSTSKEPQPSPKTPVSVNSTCPSLEPSQLSSSADINTSAQNKTLDLPPSDVNIPEAESEAPDQVVSASNNSTETSLDMNQNSSTVKACDVQNATFDRYSLRKSSSNSVLGDSGAATFCLENITFDAKPPSKQNGTITLSETSSSDSPQDTFDKPSPNATSSPKESHSEVHPPEVLQHNGTTTSTDANAKTANTPESTFEVNPAVEVASGAAETKDHSQSRLPMTDSLSDNQNMDTEDNKAQNTFDFNAKMADTPESTFEVNPAVEVACGAAETKDHSQSRLPMTDSLSDNQNMDTEDNKAQNTFDFNAKTANTPESTFDVNPAVEVASGAAETKDHSQSRLPMTDSLSDNQNMDTEDNKAQNTFDLDTTLDLRADSLITSTPMPNCKVFNLNTQPEVDKIISAQKKLYGEGPSKPDGQLPSDVLPNIACDRKAFLPQPAVRSLLPPPKAASQLLRHKPASALPGRLEALTSGLPMTRQRTQAQALRNMAAPDAPQATGISSSYKLRATTTGAKQTNSGLQRAQLSSMLPGIQRAATGLRPPSTRSNAPAASSTDKLRGPTATNPATRTSQAKKQPLTRGEALPIAKRKKMDTPLPASSAEASITSCDAANGAKNLKPPTASKRALPAKAQRDDAVVPASTAAEISTSCDAVSRTRTLKQPASSHRAQLAKPKGHGCTNCVMLEQQLKMQSEEIRRLKEELLKKNKQDEEH